MSLFTMLPVICSAPPETWDAVLLRVSAVNAQSLAANADGNDLKLEHLPAIQRLRAAGGVEALAANTPEGLALRERLGVIPIRRRDVHRQADNPNMVMGYAWPMETDQQLLLLLHDSAAENNVKVDDDPLPRNAVAELLIQVLLHPAIRAMHLPEWSRWVRATSHGQRVQTAAIAGRCQILEGTSVVDLYTQSGQIHAAIKTTGAAGNRDEIRIRTTRGTLGRLRRDEVAWPYAAALTPIGYTVGAVHREKDATAKTRRIAVLRADGEHAEGWTAFYRAIAAGASYREAGRLLATYQLPCRAQVFDRHTYDELNDAQRTGAARTLSAARHYQLLRSQTYDVVKRVPVPVAPGQKFEGYVVDYSDPAHEYGAVRFTVQLPPHSIDLSAAQWEAWRLRCAGRTSREPVTEARRHPLTGLAPWPDGDHDYHLTAAGSPQWPYYQLRRRTFAQSLNEKGNQRGWLNVEGDLVLSTPAAALDQALGRAIASGACDILNRAAPLHVAAREQRDDAAEATRRTKRRLELPEAIANATDDRDGARTALKQLVTQRREEKLQAFEASLACLNSELDRLERDLTDAPHPTLETEAELDVSTLAALAGILQGGAGKLLPRLVNDVIRQITAGTLRLDTMPGNPRVGMVRATIHWPSTTGEMLTFEVAEPVKLAAEKHAGSKSDLGASAAHLVLADGRTLEQCAALLGITRTRALDEAQHWLAARGISNPWRRSSLLDCPVVETKNIVWAALTSTPMPATCSEAFVELIKATYLTQDVTPWTSTWARDVHLARTSLNVFAAAIGRGQDISTGIRASEIARQLGVTPGEVMTLAGRPTSKPTYRRMFDRHPDDLTVVIPKRCGQCAGWLLHVVRAPETLASDGLICTSCCALPDGTPLPAAYLAQWDGPAGLHNPRAGGPGTRLGTPEDYQPLHGAIPGQLRLMRIGEASQALGVPQCRLREWANSGLIRVHRQGRNGRERFFDVAEVARLAAKLEEVPAMMAAGDAMLPGHLGLAQAAEHLQVADFEIRRLALSTPWDQGPLPYRRVRMFGRLPTIALDRRDLDNLDPAWVDAYNRERILIGEASRRTGLSVPAIRRALLAGDLPCVRTRGTARIRPQDLNTWTAEPPNRERRRDGATAHQSIAPEN
jgi:hypothetical protein